MPDARSSRRSTRAVSALGLAALILALPAEAKPPAGKGKAQGKPAPAAVPAVIPPPSKLTETAPDRYRVEFKTSKGDFIVEVNRDLAPGGADRFYNLVKAGYFDGVRFFRAIKGFMVQFGIHGDPAVNKVWREAHIPDDLVRGSNVRGAITFAMAGPNTRTVQVFINCANNTRLDRMGFPPFGRVARGMEIVDALHTGYGEGAPSGAGPEQGRVQDEGNAYLERNFPKLDHVRQARLLP